MAANPWLAAFLDEPDPIGAIGAIGMAPNRASGGANGANGANGMGRWRPPAPADWVEGMARLAEADVPANVSPSLWRARMRAGLAFAKEWGGMAHACGWSEAELFALHPAAPLIRFDAMGAAFLSCGAAVVAVTDAAITLRGEAGATRRAVRCAIPYPPAWATFRPGVEAALPQQGLISVGR